MGGLRQKIRSTSRARINERDRARLHNVSPSIIANNCNGGVICHDLGLPFLSPTVNLYIPFPDYVKFCERLEYYLSLPIEAMRQGPDDAEGWPTGTLDDIQLMFMHYLTFGIARDKWFERAARVDMDNLFFMLAMRDGCTCEDIRAFDSLPYERKVAFVDRPMPNVPCARYFSEFVDQDKGGVKVLTEYASRFSGRRIIDSFDYVGFLNRSNV